MKRHAMADLHAVIAEQAARIAQLQQTLHHRTAALHRLVAKAADQDATITALKARNRELEENQA